MHLDAILGDTAARWPQRVAVRSAGWSLTYAELDAAVTRTARGFANLGLAPGDRLAYRLRNDVPEAIVTLLAGFRAGLVVVPIGLRLPPLLVADMLRNCGARALVADAAFLAGLASGQRAGLEWIVSVDDAGAGTIAFDTLPGDASGALPQLSPADDAIGLLFSTSGTTSRPKAVAHTQRRLRARVELFVQEMGLTEADATVVVHEAGRPFVLMGQVLPVLRTGGALSLVDGVDPAGFWSAYRLQERTTFMFTAAGAIAGLLEHPAAREVSHAALRFWMCGADHVLPAAHRLAREVLGQPVREILGMTEVGFFATTPLGDEARPGSLGRAMRGCEIRIVDDHGNEVPQGSVGELLVRTPNTMVGYWNDTLESFRAFRDQWVRSGDLARIDADGQLRLHGRTKLLISRGGIKVAPPMVEEALRSHPAVRDATVVAQAHPVQGQVPFAFYQLRPGSGDPGVAALRAWLQPRLDSACIPDGFARIETWPTTDSGKVDRSRLAQLADGGGGAPA
jgi:acyl-CoA synthetase (AMP-forming)/AMP-acid ligase II